MRYDFNVLGNYVNFAIIVNYKSVVLKFIQTDIAGLFSLPFKYTF